MELKTLIIADTAGKAKALKKLLPKSYLVIGTDGLLKNLPKTKIGVDENFTPNYITVRGKGDLLQTLKKESLRARKVYFATNADSEGEFFALQCCELFGVNESSRCRLVIDEFTKPGVKSALEQARAVDENLVAAFQAKQIIDKVVSHKVGEYLECKIYRGVKVGRFRALLLKLIAGSQPSGEVEIAKKFTPEVLMELARENLNFSATKTSLVAEQLYEGFSFGKSKFAGLITSPRGEEIFLSSERHTPDSVKEILNPTQHQLYNLIYSKVTGGELESKFTPDGTCTEKSLMATFDSLKIAWSEVYAVGLNSLLKRGYVANIDGKLTVTALGEEVLQSLNFFDKLFTADNYKKLSAQFADIRAGKAEKISVIKNYLAEFEKSFSAAWESLGENPQPKEEPALPSEEVCDKCGRMMLIKRGRFGRFLACSGYPECKNTKPLLNYIEQKCPKCGGRLTRRTYKGGRNFYSCENFKTCNFTTWDEPQEKLCKECGRTMFLHRFKDRAPMLYCGNDDCPSRKNHPMNKIIGESRKRYEEVKLRRAKRKNLAAQ